MFESLTYAYWVGNIMLMAIWALLFIARSDLRKEMIVMSLLIAPLGPLSEVFYTQDYWVPEVIGGLSLGLGWPVALEDLVFAFGIGGVAAVFYEELFGKRHKGKPRPLSPTPLILFDILFIVSLALGLFVLGVNTIYVSVIFFIVFGLAIVWLRKDLFKEAFISAVLAAILTVLVYFIFLSIFPSAIEEWWMLKNISGVFILGIPIEEILWFFSWGFVIAPLYEFASGKRLSG